MGKPLIVIAIPTGKPLIKNKLPDRVINLAREFNLLLPEFEVIVSHSACPREAHALNTLIEEFRNHPLATWFVWWNISVQLEAEQLKQLITCGQAICGAICTHPEDATQWNAAFYPDILPDENHLIPVAELGGDVKVFHRAVFDMIENGTPDLSYIFDNSGRSCSAFAQEQLVQFGEYRRLLTPANFLDSLCRKAGLGLWAHAGVVLKRRDSSGKLQPEKEPYRPWLFKHLPPPVCAQDLPERVVDKRTICVALQYCDKDKEQAHRFHQSSPNVPMFLIHSHGDHYPKAPNSTALGLLRGEWPEGCKAVLLLEPDCCPVAPDWLDQLSRDWDRCAAAGKLIMGSWHPINADHPTMGHLNGNLMFSPKLKDAVVIPDVPDDKPWDTYLADVFQPYWARTGLIKNLNRHRTATTRQLTEPECGTHPPVLIHGVKDDSAWNLSHEQTKLVQEN